MNLLSLGEKARRSRGPVMFVPRLPCESRFWTFQHVRF